MLPGVNKGGKNQEENQHRSIEPLEPLHRVLGSLDLDELSSRHGRNQRHVLLGTGVDAVQTEGAIHVVGLFRLEQFQLAAPLLVVASQAVMRRAGVTDFDISHAHFHGRISD